MGSAGRGDDVAAFDPRIGRAHPSLGPRDVVDQFARREEPTEDRVDHSHIGDLIGAERGPCLVAVDQPFLDAIRHHEHAAQVGQRHELDIRVAVPPAYLDRLAQQRLTNGRIRLDERAEDEHPTVLRLILAGLTEQRAGPREPSATHRPFAEDGACDPEQRPGDPSGRANVPRLTVRGVRALVVFGGREVLAFEIQRLTQRLQRLAGRSRRHRALEQTPTGGEVTAAHRGQAIGHERVGHQPMIAWSNQTSDSPTPHCAAEPTRRRPREHQAGRDFTQEGRQVGPRSRRCGQKSSTIR